MTCQQLDDILDVYAAGELDREPAADAERHAAECSECAGRLEAARRRLQALDGVLAGLRKGDDFAERVMARIRAEAPPAAEPDAEPAPDRLRTRLLRYAAYAAAACLFILAGYGFLRRPALAHLRQGPMVRVGSNAGLLSPGAAIGHNEVVATPADAKGLACLDLAAGRMRAVLSPGSELRLTDPRSGVVASLERGDLFWRVLSKDASPVIASPLARVQGGRGDFSLHVAPRPDEERGRFSGQVTVVAHTGDARVHLAGQGGGVLELHPGQILALRSDPRRIVAQPVAFDLVQKQLQGQLRELQQRRAGFERQWLTISQAVRQAPTGQHPDLFRRGVVCQETLRQTDAACAELSRRLELLQHCHDEGQHIFRVVLQQFPDQP